MHGVKRPLLLTDDTDKAVAGRLNQHNRHLADIDLHAVHARFEV